MKILNLALIGFGNAGKAFAQQLSENHQRVMDKYSTDVRVVAISTNSRGSLVNPSGLDLMRQLEYLNSHGTFDRSDPDYSKLNSLEIIRESNYDVMIELTPLAIFSGQPAIDHITEALSRKRHVITANKGPVAWKYAQLSKLAKDNQVFFYCETTVMDGTPIFNMAEETLQLCQIEAIDGILNSTTNFILEELALGKDYDTIIQDGRNRGFIEEDSAMDIEGYDAAAKVTALINVLMDGNLTPDQIDRKGIEDITPDHIAQAAEEGKVIKLICSGSRTGDKVTGRVRPEAVAKDSIYAAVHGTSSLISIKTDLMGTVTILEEDPEIQQTAYGIFSDLLRILRNQK